MSYQNWRAAIKRKTKSRIAQKIVLSWGNSINWGRYADEFGDHITEEDRFRLQHAITIALRKASKKNGRKGGRPKKVVDKAAQ